MSTVDLFVKLRDAHQLMADAYNEQLEKMAPSPETPSTKTTAAVAERNFDLTYTKRTRAKLGEFEIADEKDSPADLYTCALNILKQNGAAINKRYSGEGYVYSYWLYNGKIFRKK